MNSIFPEPVAELPLADIPLDGVEARLSQGEDHQILFMTFSEDVDLPEHSHEAQWGLVLEGEIELTIDGRKSTFVKGDRYYIPAGVVHSGKVFSGYADVTFFNEKDRYKVVGE